MTDPAFFACTFPIARLPHDCCECDKGIAVGDQDGGDAT